MSEYVGLAKEWVEVTQRVAAGAWEGIVCPKNADADVLIEVREQRTGTDDARFEYWIHCPQCGAEIYFPQQGPVQSGAESGRLTRLNSAGVESLRRVEVLSGLALFPAGIARPPRAWLQRTANTVRVSEPPRGGHFAAFEEPEIYAEELRTFFRPYRIAVR